MLTPEIMEQEAQTVADGIVTILRAATRKGQNFNDAIGLLVGQGLATFGDIEAGLDDDANRERFVLNVVAKVLDSLVDRLPLTEET